MGTEIRYPAPLAEMVFPGKWTEARASNSKAKTAPRLPPNPI